LKNGGISASGFWSLLGRFKAKNKGEDVTTAQRKILEAISNGERATDKMFFIFGNEEKRMLMVRLEPIIEERLKSAAMHPISIRQTLDLIREEAIKSQ
jgi:hypothetical protein